MIRRAAISIVALACLCASHASAQTSVTLCDIDTQGGAGVNLAQAISRGGRIVFDCPPQTRIRMTTGHVVRPGTVIDGGDRVILDAQGLATIMFSAPGSLSLERITIRGARVRRSTVSLRSSVIHALGDVTLDHVMIESSESPVTIRGNARVLGSRFTGNQGSAVDIGGAAEVEESSFIGNDTGLAMQLGRVHKSVFNQNKTGALRISYPKGEVRIIGSTFDANDGQGAILLSQRSSGDSPGAVIVRRSVFTLNSHRFGGGAINVYDTTADAQGAAVSTLRQYGPARFVIAYSRFTGNTGRSGGAIYADLSNTSGMVIKGGIFIGNQGTETGGAMSWQGRSILMTHCLFKANRTGNDGSALYGRNQNPGSTWSVANSLVVENIAGAARGAIDAGPVALINVTIARNTGFGVLAGAAPQPMIANAILSENSEGNCRGVNASAFRGGNLQVGRRDCPGVPETDPFLDALYVPDVGSPAFTLGDVAVCRAAPVSRTDIVFQSRGVAERCATGAFERPPVRRFRSREGRAAAPDPQDVLTNGLASAPSNSARFVLDALKAEEQVSHRRTELTLSRGEHVSRYIIDRASPDRLHLVSSGSIGEQEFFVVRGRVYQRVDGSWEETKAALPSPVPWLPAMLENRLGQVTEGAPLTENGVGLRTFRASLVWPSSNGTNRGMLDFTIAAETKLPHRISFSGECGGVRCSFEQTFDYDVAITIDPPR